MAYLQAVVSESGTDDTGDTGQNSGSGTGEKIESFSNYAKAIISECRLHIFFAIRVR
jgi:hypothetical protein